MYRQYPFSEPKQRKAKVKAKETDPTRSQIWLFPVTLELLSLLHVLGFGAQEAGARHGQVHPDHSEEWRAADGARGGRGLGWLGTEGSEIPGRAGARWPSGPCIGSFVCIKPATPSQGSPASGG